MQTSTHSRRAPRRAHAAGGKLPLPQLPDSDSRFFWLAAYFIDSAQLEALSAVCDRAYSTSRPRPYIERLALTSACNHQRDELQKSFKYVVRKGLLPFAWAGTTVFTTEAVPA